jgi:hypothetical protein
VRPIVVVGSGRRHDALSLSSWNYCIIGRRHIVSTFDFSGSAVQPRENSAFVLAYLSNRKLLLLLHKDGRCCDERECKAILWKGETMIRQDVVP